MPRPHHFSSPRAFAGAVRYESVLRTRRARIERGLARGGPVIVGPWLSEIGFELLYWIPTLRRLFARHGIAPSQVTVVSRGGVASWYGDLADRYVDLFDLMDVETFRRGQRERVGADGGEKQFVISSLDRLVRERLGAPGVWVHPLVMYSRLRYYWAADAGLAELDRRCEYAPITPPAPPPGLPERYVAAKPYFSACFPDTPDNRAVVTTMLRRLAETVDVVLLTTGLGLDDHAEAELVEHPRIHTLDLRPQDNLAVQTAVIGGAEALYATYGGPSYLGVLLGVPTVALASVPNHNPRHLETVNHVAAKLGAPPLRLVDANAAVQAPLNGARS